MARSDGPADHVQACPRCNSPFDDRVHRIVTCPECSAECSTACCMPGGEDGWCPECDESNPNDN